MSLILKNLATLTLEMFVKVISFLTKKLKVFTINPVELDSSKVSLLTIKIHFTTWFEFLQIYANWIMFGII